MTDEAMLQYALGGFGVAICLTISAIWLYVLARRENVVLRKQNEKLSRRIDSMHSESLTLKTWAPQTTKKPLILSDRKFVPNRLIMENPGAHLAVLEAERMIDGLLHSVRQYVKVDSHAVIDGIELSASLMLIDQKDR